MPVTQQNFGPIYQWSILILLGLVYFLATATTFTSLGVVLPSMIAELEWNWTQAGLGFTLLGLTCGLASFLPTLLIRKLNVRFTLLIGLIILSVDSIFYMKPIPSHATFLVPPYLG